MRAPAAGQTLRLFGSDVVVQEFSGPATRASWLRKASETKLVRDDGAVSVWLTEKGPATVRVKFLAKVGGDAVNRQLGFAIPPALRAEVALTLAVVEPQPLDVAKVTGFVSLSPRRVCR